jgi:L-aminopeptidase/D-esterase-like protein
VPAPESSLRKNMITDVRGLRVGHAHEQRLASGVTAILFDEPAIAAIDVRGGAPGTRESDLLLPERTVERVDAVALSGGSAFGLEAAAGVMAALAEDGRGFRVGGARVPVVPAAILFDLLNGGDKEWGRYPPYRELGYEAARAAGPDFALGSIGAGLGATTATLKGGVGSASATIGNYTVGAIVAVNAFGSATIGEGPHFWAAPFEVGDEFGALGLPQSFPSAERLLRVKGRRAENTTVGLVATDATLTKGEVRHLAIMAQDGLARAIHPVHTPLDGDVVFAAATCLVPISARVDAMIPLGAAAADVLARACARAVYNATALPFAGGIPAWRDLHGSS